MTTPPDRCTHSFPDPYPQPMTQPGNCRGCGITYQAAKEAAMTNPADELRAAAEALRPELSGREITLPSGAIISRTLAEPFAKWLDRTAAEVTAAEGTEYELHPDGGVFAGWEAALAAAHAINGEVRR